MTTNKQTRRSFLKNTGLSLTALTIPGCRTLTPKDPGRRPNILFCLADDWGWPHAGAYGDKVVRTPTFDRLAREGALFSQAFVSAPSCTPCRNSLITGQQFYRLGEGANLWSTLDVREPNFMFMLRQGGYEIGHWRKAWGPGKFSRGGYGEHPCGPRSNFKKFMTNRDQSKPFCFWFGTSDPHRGYKKGSGKKSGIDVDRVHLPDFYPDSDQIRGDMADYYFEVQRWDNDVNSAIEALATAGELENTVIVMTGDHGMPFPRCKGNLYDWGVHVPLAIRWGKGIAPGQRINRFASFTDLAPTFLDLAGIKASPRMTGRSLLPLLTGKGNNLGNEDDDFVVFGRERHTPAQKMPSMGGYPARGIRTWDWLFIMNLEPDRWPAGVPDGATHKMNRHADCDNGPTKSFLFAQRNDPKLAKFYNLCFARRPAIELYDCRDDPDQVVNLAGDPGYAERGAELQRKLTSYLSTTGDPRFTGRPVRFDQYPYQAGYLKKYLEKHGYGKRGRL